MLHHGYHFDSLPTDERRTEIMTACDAEATRVAKLVGMSAWYEHQATVLTADERAMLRRAFLDDRNPGTVTMQRLFIAWVTPPATPPRFHG